jgi:hypothetical protein
VGYFCITLNKRRLRGALPPAAIASFLGFFVVGVIFVFSFFLYSSPSGGGGERQDRMTYFVI